MKRAKRQELAQKNLFHKIQVTKSPAVRVSTLIDKLNDFVINHGRMLRDRKKTQSEIKENPKTNNKPSLDSSTNNEKSIVENDETLNKKKKKILN